jgi:hypothetical protein
MHASLKCPVVKDTKEEAEKWVEGSTSYSEKSQEDDDNRQKDE